MKKVYLIIFLFIGVAASAQAPDKMSYQAVIRDANGEILKNQDVSITDIYLWYFGLSRRPQTNY
jgi:hypothetical protein